MARAMAAFFAVVVMVRCASAVQIAEAPVDAITNVGGTAAFRVTLASATPATFQWLRDGSPVAGATHAVLAIAPVTASDAGAYRVRVTDAVGTVESAEARLILEPPPAVPIVDPSFRGDASLKGGVVALQPLPDGRLLVALNERAFDPVFIDEASRLWIVRLLPDGRIDPAFQRGAPTGDEFDPAPSLTPLGVSQFLLQPDGRVIVVGRFAHYNGRVRAGIARLHPDGSLDESFVGPADVLPERRNRVHSPYAALQPDGRILITDGAAGSTLIRLLADGRRDPDFPAVAAAVVAAGEGGRIFVATRNIFTAGGAEVWALLPNGQPDPAFARFRCDSVEQLHAVRGGRVVVTTRYDRGPRPPEGSRFRVTTFRLLADGSLDTTLGVRSAALGAPPAPDGSLLIGNRLVAEDGRTERAPNFGAGFTTSLVKAFAPDGRLYVGGGPIASEFTSYNGVATNRIARLNLVDGENARMPRILDAWLDRALVKLNEPVTVRVAAVATGPLTYTWSYRGGAILGVTLEPSFVFTPPAAQGLAFRVRVTNSAGETVHDSPEFAVSTEDEPPRIVFQPRRVSWTPGLVGSLRLEISPLGVALAAEWRHNGVLLAPDALRLDANSLTVVSVDASHAGTYTLTLRDERGRTFTSDPIVVTVGDMARFTNLSTRAAVGVGEAAAILGFVIPSGSIREVMIRGVGPSLAAFGVGQALAAVRLDVFDSAGRALARNNGWDVYDRGPVPAEFDQVGAFRLPAGSKDAAVKLTLRPGAYTARLTGSGDTTGVGLIELYETDRISDRLLNMSARVLVGATLEETAIAGFAIRGTVPKRVLVRAAGPALMAFQVGGVVADPVLEIRSDDGRVVAGNDDWQNQPDSGEVANAIARVNAFAFPAGSRDSALVTTLAPGNYTALARGSSGGTGVALVEIYELP